VAGLWVTSPPDMVDALLFVSPTPFSAWGVIAMWALFAAALLALLRRRLHLRFRTWRLGHTTLTSVTVLGSVVHAMLIEGTMEIMTKTALCVLVLSASTKTLADLRVWVIRTRRFD
jgi:predicted ferric reductase